MAKTANELREHIEEYLNCRIRAKHLEDRSHREAFLLETLQTASETLLQQEAVKVRQHESALETLREMKIAELLRFSAETSKLGRVQRAIEGDE